MKRSATHGWALERRRLAGLPPEVVARARDILQNLEPSELDDGGRPRLARRGAKAAVPSPGHLELFGGGDAKPKVEPAQAKVLEPLKAVNPDELTPLDALNLLARLRRDLKTEDKGR